MSDQPLIDWTDDLLRVVEDLGGLPRPGFRARLKAELERRARMGTVATRQPGLETGLRTVTPYLIVQDAPALLDFVARVFDADERLRGIGSAGGIHAEVRIGDSTLMMGGGGPGLAWRGESSPAALHIYVPDVDAVYERALEAGAEVMNRPEDTEHGERVGSLVDPGGNRWYVATWRGAHHVQEGLQTVNVFLHPPRAEPMLRFLERAFDAERVEHHATPQGVVVHAKVDVGDTRLELSEAHGAYQPLPATFYLSVADADETYRRAVEAGAAGIAAPANLPYGRVGTVKDVFGHTWYVSGPM
jgi:uncharacterized glyoxalase superfamily protein PhnB